MSKEFTKNDREAISSNYGEGSLPVKCLTALQMAEAENDAMKERLHNANLEISSLTDLRPEN